MRRGNRTKRLLAIRQIISDSKVSNQEELLKRLLEKGYSYTQATLSRDLKFLGVAKKADKLGGYMYVLPDQGLNIPHEPVHGPYPINGFQSLQFSGNLAVIRTQPGYASGIAILIDNRSPFEIIGTIAGDDTILIIPRDGVVKHEVIKALVLIFPELEGKI
jgi:transcriptional regulator of arginine metabolism